MRAFACASFVLLGAGVPEPERAALRAVVRQGEQPVPRLTRRLHAAALAHVLAAAEVKRGRMPGGGRHEDMWMYGTSSALLSWPIGSMDYNGSSC